MRSILRLLPLLLILLLILLLWGADARAQLAEDCPVLIPVSQTGSTDLYTPTNITTNVLHICSVVLISASQQQISLVEGTGTNCGTNTKALIGGTSASAAVAANGGFSAPSARSQFKTAVVGDHLCTLQSGGGNVSGYITLRDAP